MFLSKIGSPFNKKNSRFSPRIHYYFKGFFNKAKPNIPTTEPTAKANKYPRGLEITPITKIPP